MNLWRAVSPQELEDLLQSGRFRNPDGIENKYFAPTVREATKYAVMAQAAYADGPYSIVVTAIGEESISTEMRACAEVEIVTIPTLLLAQLAPPGFIKWWPPVD